MIIDTYVIFPYPFCNLEVQCVRFAERNGMVKVEACFHQYNHDSELFCLLLSTLKKQSVGQNCQKFVKPLSQCNVFELLLFVKPAPKAFMYCNKSQRKLAYQDILEAGTRN